MNVRLASSMTLQICRMPLVTASTLPDTVTSRSVELGNMSPEIWIDAPAIYTHIQRVAGPRYVTPLYVCLSVCLFLGSF